MGVYVYTITGSVKDLNLTPEASKCLGVETAKGIRAEFYQPWYDNGIPWTEEERNKCKRLGVESLNTLNHGKGKYLITRLEKRKLDDVEFVLFNDDCSNVQFRMGRVEFFDTPDYTHKGQIGHVKKIKSKYYLCPRFCLVKVEKWRKAVVEDIKIKRGKVISYVVKIGIFYPDQGYIENSKYVEVKPENIDFQYGFLSYREPFWNTSDSEVNRIKLNSKLKKIKM